MFNVILPALYFTILCLLLTLRHKRFELSALMAAIYAVSAWMSIIVYLYNLRDLAHDVPHIPFAYPLIYCSLITLTILPFSHLHSEKIERIPQPNMRLFNLVAYAFIITFILTVINLLPDIISTLLSGDLQDIRNDVYSDQEQVTRTGIHYLLALPETLLSPCSPLMMMMFFYSICFLKKPRWFNIALFLSSTTPIMPAILIAGRTQIVYWIFILIASYLFFSPHLSARQKHIFTISGGCILGFFVLFMLAVTVARWDFHKDMYNMLCIYTGEPYIQFCKFMDQYHNNHIHLQRLFPFTHYFLLHRNIDLNDYREVIDIESGMSIHIFYTFLGDLLVDIGRTGMILYCLVYNFLTNSFLRRKDSAEMPFYQLLIVSICMLVPLEGLFYYSFHTIRMSYYIIETAFLYLLFRRKTPAV